MDRLGSRRTGLLFLAGLLGSFFLERLLSMLFQWSGPCNHVPAPDRPAEPFHHTHEHERTSQSPLVTNILMSGAVPAFAQEGPLGGSPGSPPSEDPRFWARAEYLGWWLKNAPVPVSVTTGSAANPTEELLNSNQNFGLTSGGRGEIVVRALDPREDTLSGADRGRAARCVGVRRDRARGQIGADRNRRGVTLSC